MRVSFAIAKSRLALVNKIVERAVRLNLAGGKHWYTEQTCRMDLVATHANGCPMAFRRLLDAPDFDFTHDICGIARHIDRESGKLRGFFHPRSAARFAPGPLFCAQNSEMGRVG
jgi:hypothetical protein